MIALVDSGVANLTSVLAALERLDATVRITSNPEEISAASHVILPGVGAAQAAMASLGDKGLIETLRKLTQPVLGICLGMQLLFEHSDEGEGATGLGVLSDTITSLPSVPNLPLPHMGWNQITLKQPNHPLLVDVPQNSFFYFVHSFAAPLSEATLASTTYGRPFTAMVARDNFMGCQFHPERSSAMGQLILRNFLRL